MHELERLILNDQESNGSFLSYSVPKDMRFDNGARVYYTTFMPALIIGALAEVPGQEMTRARKRAAKFLLTQAGPQWSFNYWTREAAEAKTQPYPDDWDDTSCTIVALTRVLPEAVTGEVLGNIVTMLTNTEVAEGGPYRTWVVPENAHKHWHDIDVAVNANIAYMLKLHGVELPNLEQLVTERIARGALVSPYYPSPYPIEYFVSRWYRGEHVGRLRDRILARRRNGRWGNTMETALAVSATLNLGAAPETVAAAVKWLRDRGTKEIEAEAFCIDPAIEGRTYVAGSRALTAALIMEAVAKYDAAIHEAEPNNMVKSKSGRKQIEADGIHAQVVGRAMERLGESGAELMWAANQLHDRLLGGPAAGHITLLPYRFRQALGKTGSHIPDGRVVELGIISFYGWVAYTIYDDFLDEEGDPRLLSVANVALRELTLALDREATRTQGLGTLAWSILDQQEAANAWEVTYCRVGLQSELLRLKAPDFGDRQALAARSMGHALGALALTLGLGYAPESAEIRAVQKFFRHFLIARQLSDDVHDWKDDLRQGQLNAVGARVLAGTQERGTSVRGLYIKLEQTFWERTLSEVDEWIRDELAGARAALAELKFVERPEVMEALLAPIETSMQEVMLRQRRAAEFLQAYRPGQQNAT